MIDSTVPSIGLRAAFFEQGPQRIVFELDFPELKKSAVKLLSKKPKTYHT